MSGKTIAIVGGGFAGVNVAKRLEKKLGPDDAIVLFSRDNHITYNPLLAEVVSASILPGHAVAPLRQMLKRTRVLMAEVYGIDLENRQLHFRAEDEGVMSYDQLVLAFGVNANVDMIPGMAEHGLPLKTLGDALHMRNHLLDRLEQAEVETDEDEQCWLTSFIIIGGGFSGIEVAGEVLDFLRRVNRYYPNTNSSGCHVVLLHDGRQILPEISQRLGDYAFRKMSRSGLTIRLDSRATRVTERGVVLESGEEIEAGTVICTVGTTNNTLSEKLDLPTERGRIKTNPDLSVPDHPGVWSLGDCALVPNAEGEQPCPPTAQFATRQAKQLADNLAATLAGKPTHPFSYTPIGQVATIGRHKAVAQIYGMRLSGFPAWLLWRGYYLLKLPTLARKVRVFLEWSLGMFFPPDIARLNFKRTRKK